MTINTNLSYSVSKWTPPESKNFKTIDWPDLITRDISACRDKSLQRAALIDQFLSQRQYALARKEIIKLSNLDLKTFYTIELIDQVVDLNRSLAEKATLSLEPGIIKDSYLTRLGRSYLSEDNLQKTKEIFEAIITPEVKAPFIHHFQMQNAIEDKLALRKLNRLCEGTKGISLNLAKKEINKLHDAALKDTFRAKFGKILFRNGKSNGALDLVQEIQDPFKKDEIHAEIVSEYLNLNNAPDSIPFYDQIQDSNLKEIMKDKILASCI